MVTSVSGRRLPVLSETVPVMPPKVFCALAYGASANDPSRVKAVRNAANPILLFMRAPINICDRRYHAILLVQCSQRRRLALLRRHVRLIPESTRGEGEIKGFRRMKISLTRIRYFYAEEEFYRESPSRLSEISSITTHAPQQFASLPGIAPRLGFACPVLGCPPACVRIRA